MKKIVLLNNDLSKNNIDLLTNFELGKQVPLMEQLMIDLYPFLNRIFCH